MVTFREQEGTSVMQPSQMQTEYTDYYKHHDSDSPEKSRQYLICKLLPVIREKLKNQPRITILDVGSGKQIFEKEAQEHQELASMQERIDWFTIDIATLSSKSLLSTIAEHVQANGAELPFADNTFDVIFSSMAVDFMPRSTFLEIQRVAKSSADVLINFHHPDLIERARAKRFSANSELSKARRRLNQKIRFSTNKSKIDTLKRKVEIAELQVKDIQFVLYNFPEHVFSCVEEIEAFLLEHLGKCVSLNEYSNFVGHNGWFFAHAKLEE